MVALILLVSAANLIPLAAIGISIWLVVSTLNRMHPLSDLSKDTP